MPARDHGDVDAPARADCLRDGRGPFARGYELDLFNRKARARDELFAVVDERDAVADRHGESRERRADVARAADHNARLRLDALEHHARAAPRLQSGRELFDSKRLRLGTRRRKGTRVLRQSPVERGIAGRARARARRLYEEFRADALRGFDDCRERGRRAFPEQTRDATRYVC